MHKKSVRDANEKYKFAADPPQKPVRKKSKSTPVDVVTANNEIRDMRKNLASEKARWKKLKNAAKQINPETKKRQKVAAEAGASPRL